MWFKLEQYYITVSILHVIYVAVPESKCLHCWCCRLHYITQLRW